jgi:hypothetical protein
MLPVPRHSQFATRETARNFPTREQEPRPSSGAPIKTEAYGVKMNVGGRRSSQHPLIVCVCGLCCAIGVGVGYAVGVGLSAGVSSQRADEPPEPTTVYPCGNATSWKFSTTIDQRVPISLRDEWANISLSAWQFASVPQRIFLPRFKVDKVVTSLIEAFPNRTEFC